MTNGFRFCYPVPPGPVTEEDLFNLFPMDAGIRVGKLTGRQLREFREDGLDQVFASDAYRKRGGWGPRPSGMTVRVRLGQPKGKRVVWMKVGGKLVRDEDVFTVASCDRPGDPAGVLCRFPNASETRVLDTTIQQAMRAYLRNHRVIRPQIEGRVRAEDTSGQVWSQYEFARSSSQ